MRAHAAQIDLDVERTFPNHPDFRAPDKGAPGGTGAKLEPLRRVLMALAHSRPDVGYTQGLNFVAGATARKSASSASRSSRNDAKPGEKYPANASSNRDAHNQYARSTTWAAP